MNETQKLKTMNETQKQEVRDEIKRIYEAYTKDVAISIIADRVFLAYLDGKIDALRDWDNIFNVK